MDFNNDIRINNIIYLFKIFKKLNLPKISLVIYKNSIYIK